jgi:hypothetical protein
VQRDGMTYIEVSSSSKILLGLVFSFLLLGS